MSISSNRVKAWRHRTKERMVEAMGGKCQCCGYDTCKEALAFHHIDPAQKELAFGSLRANPKTWAKVVDELKKCILVCHNCHSEIHAGVRELPKQYAMFDEEFASIKRTQEYDSCPVCGSDKSITNSFCSPTCATTNRRKVDWDKIDLIDLMSKHGISELENMLGISNAAIYKRRNKILSDKKT